MGTRSCVKRDLSTKPECQLGRYRDNVPVRRAGAKVLRLFRRDERENIPISGRGRDAAAGETKDAGGLRTGLGS